MATPQTSALDGTAHTQAKSPIYKSYINPHQFQNEQLYEYFIGDIYDRYQAMAEGKWDHDNANDGPYLRHIKRLARNGWPQLRYLADFIECSTVPVKNKFLVADDRQERRARVHIVTLDFEPGKEPVKQELRSKGDLSHFLSSNVWKDEKGHARLFVVEDLSSSVIELLGSCLDIDPCFFRAHLGDYVWYNMRDPWFEMPLIHSRSMSNAHFTLRYQQPRYFRHGTSIETAKQQVGAFNVLRRIDFDVSNKTSADLKGSAVGLVRSSTSSWVRPRKSDDEGWLGVLLVDPGVSEGYPLWNGYDNIRVPPGMNSSRRLSPNLYKSPLEDFVYWTSSMRKDELALSTSDPEYIISAIFSSIPAQWLLVFEHVTTRLALIEWELESEKWRTPVGLDDTLRKLHPWRRRVANYGNQIQASLDCVTSRYSFGSTNSQSHWQSLVQNFQQLQKRHKMLQVKVDKIVSVLTAIISIEESKKAMMNARDVTRITYLAFVYIPLTFVASFFSMNDNFPTGRMTVYWIYFVVSLPVAGISVFLAVYWGSMEKKFRELFKRGRRDSNYKR